MRRQPGRLGRIPASRPGLLCRGWLTRGLMVVSGLLIAGCWAGGVATTFRPAGVATPGRDRQHGQPAPRPRRDGPTTRREPWSWPPFGRDVHIVDARLAAGKWRRKCRPWITAKDFLLAVLYAEYRGNQDDRWAAYAAGAGPHHAAVHPGPGRT